MMYNDYLFGNLLTNHWSRIKTKGSKIRRKEILVSPTDMRWIKFRIQEMLHILQPWEQSLHPFLDYFNFITNFKRIIISFIYGIASLIRSYRFKDRNVKVTCISKGLTEIPVDFSNGIKIYALDVSHNSIQFIPDRIGELLHLRHLRLASNCIDVITDNLKNLTQLIYLDLTDNDLKTFPECVTDMPWLKKLGLGNCKLCSIPNDIQHMKSLEQFGLYGNNLRILCDEIGYLENLVRLDLSDNLLKSLPHGIGKLTKLEWLNLSSNQLTELPIEINNLIKLKELGLGNNRFSKLPNIFELKNLELLSLVGNQLDSLDVRLVNLVVLKILDVGYNKIRWISSYIFEMKKLETLYLQYNDLQHLPSVNILISLEDQENIHHLQILNTMTIKERIRFYDNCRKKFSLNTLDISNNELTSIPFPYLEIPNLLCYNNPFDLENDKITDPLETYLVSEKLQLSNCNMFNNVGAIRYILCGICKQFTPTPRFMFNYKQFGTINKITNILNNQLQQIDYLPISYPICRYCNK